MDGSKIITLNEVSQTEKGNYDTAYVWKLKKKQRHTYFRNTGTFRHRHAKFLHSDTPLKDGA